MLDFDIKVAGSSKYGVYEHQSSKEIGCFGEDVFMSYRSKNGKYHYLAVADGVGSWREDRIDPVEFPKALMEELKKIIEALKEDEEKTCSDMIQEGYAILKAEHLNGNLHYGSCTFNLAKINLLTGETEVANIGDSALSILKSCGSSHQTRIAQKGFNWPYQIGIEMRGPQIYLDCKADTQTYYFKLENGDKLISATDGVWDGMNFNQVDAEMKEPHSLESICANIYKKARSWNRKTDDVTIILAQFKEI